ncbi:helix-turn-helix domain-containing protein [Tahibacter amnicola]|uniref:CRP-like protein Clp n=1 Tax=Tahibacter amnicola TaxID=2976241 RepID=A0ABY6BBQ3_9GAMM|nr:helix-turn-helix domain-containing protein [Tahibacter amnicola]UXI66583.1 helix-turn-helix domain-containing protein [Tahibacter amnicola]
MGHERRIPTDNSLAPPGIADDGDAMAFCTTCAFGAACTAEGYDKNALRELHCLVEHTGIYHEGDYVFRKNTPFTAIYAMRAGMVKTCLVDERGREHVLGFFLPGEMIGLNAIYPERYPCDAIALDTVTLCQFSFPAMVTLSTRMPTLQQQLFKLMSKDIGNASLLAGDHSADERLAAFLIDLGARYAARGFSATRFRLSMSRTDIANYLHLAAETVSRVLRRLQNQNLIHVSGREVEIVDPAGMNALARCILQP